MKHRQQGNALIIVIVVIALIVTGALLFSKGSTRTGTDTPEVKRTFVTVGTGSITGVYYQVGNAISKVVAPEKDKHGVNLTVRTTGGSVYNINALLSGDLQLGVAQSDRQYQAYKGLAEWKDKGPQQDLRAICSFHPEMVTLVAAEESGIRTLLDLKGKTINIGNPGSGQRGNALDIFRVAGLDPKKDFTAEGLKAGESAGMLHDGRIDAFFYTVGHPNGAIKEASNGRRQIRFIPITGMEALLRESPFYAVAQIPVKHYSKAANKEDVTTIGVMTTLLTSSQVSEDSIYTITRAVFENLKTVQEQHPAFAKLTAKGMLTRGLSAPFHPGALRYYKEVGLDKWIQK